ncbi:MAG TPA: PilZ domain-containing protein [Terriglobales bacterium]|nr:PilZ domain-containing protein [Terriglobales bacterium]
MLNHGRYEGIVVDCHLGDDAFVAIENARLSPSNRRSVILAITGSGEHVKKAFLAGANFTLDAPLSPDSVQQLLKAAHQIMQNERRKYTRRACCVSASLERPAQPPCHCQTLNVAEGGICVLTDHPQPLNDNVTISFHLPGDSIEIRADCQVCWRDEQGRVGLEFLFMTMQCKEHLQKWLQRTGAAD